MQKHDKNTNIKQEKPESEKGYFLTPSTSLDKQREVPNYDSFDESNETYQRSTARVVFKKYFIK